MVPEVNVSGIIVPTVPQGFVVNHSAGVSQSGSTGGEADTVEVISVVGDTIEVEDKDDAVCSADVCNVSLDQLQNRIDDAVRDAIMEDMARMDMGSQYSSPMCANGRSREDILEAYLDATQLLLEVRNDSVTILGAETASLRGTLGLLGVSIPNIRLIIETSGTINAGALYLIISQTTDRLEAEYQAAISTCDSINYGGGDPGYGGGGPGGQIP